MNLSRMAVPCWFQYNSPVCFPQDPRPFLRVFGWARWGPYSGHSPPLHTDDVAAQTILDHSSWGEYDSWFGLNGRPDEHRLRSRGAAGCALDRLARASPVGIAAVRAAV